MKRIIVIILCGNTKTIKKCKAFDSFEKNLEFENVRKNTFKNWKSFWLIFGTQKSVEKQKMSAIPNYYSKNCCAFYFQHNFENLKFHSIKLPILYCLYTGCSILIPHNC